MLVNNSTLTLKQSNASVSFVSFSKGAYHNISNTKKKSSFFLTCPHVMKSITFYSWFQLYTVIINIYIILFISVFQCFCVREPFSHILIIYIIVFIKCCFPRTADIHRIVENKQGTREAYLPISFCSF